MNNHPDDLSIANRIASGAAGDRQVRIVDDNGSMVESSWRSIHQQARRVASRLRKLEVCDGEPLAIVGPTSMDLVTLLQAGWLAGAIPVHCGRLSTGPSKEARNKGIRARAAASGASILVVDGDVEPFTAMADVRVLQLNDIVSVGRLAPSVEASAALSTDGALLQFTSGSTSNPSLVRVTQQMLAANLDALAERQELDPSCDHIVSWLPLFHDLGMICMFIQAMTTGTPLFLADPINFVRSPSSWLDWISDFGGTITAAPDSAYSAAVRAARPSRLGTLRRLRVAINGAEPIDSVSFARFVSLATAQGAAPSVAAPAYGLAEATVGVTLAETGDELRTAPPFEAEPGRVGGRELVLLGPALSGVEIRIHERPEFTRMHPSAGEILVRGASVFAGYENSNDNGRPSSLVDGWLQTGDIGYKVNEQLVVCGREKNVLILGGINILAEDLELTAGRAADVPAAQVVAVPLCRPGHRERIALLLEVAPDDLASKATDVRAAIFGEFGVAPSKMWALERGAIPRTTSGKPRRMACERIVANLDDTLSF